MMKENWWTWSVFVLEACNYNPESQWGIIMWAPSPSDRGVGGENENQRYHRPLKEEGPKKSRVFLYFLLVLEWKEAKKKKSQTFLPSLSVSCSYIFLFTCLVLPLLLFCHSSLRWFPYRPLPPPSLTVFQATQGNYNSKWQNGDHHHVTGSSEMKWPMKTAYVC